MPISRSGNTAPELPVKGVRIAISLGDPAGIGPEVTVKALQSFKNPFYQFLLLGPQFFYEAQARGLGLKIPANVRFYYEGPFPNKILPGHGGTSSATAAVKSVEWAATLALEKKVDAIVTPPIHKASVRKAGFDIPGHTEFLAALSKTKHYEMMLVGGPLRVVPVTRHTAIKNVPRLLTRDRLKEAIRLTARELSFSFGIARPRLVVCGLNPHAGEAGNFGREEIEIIAPAVREMKKKLKNAELVGPLSPDALFYDAYTGRYDAEICMYHDQGLIPLKMISRGRGVNVTLGLPFVRTSPDHGTAYDIAGKSKADAGSMREAINLAVAISRNRKKKWRT